MSQTVKKNLVLTFKTNKGKDIKVTLNKPKDNLEGAVISKAMDMMISADVLGEEGKIIGKECATYITQQSDTIDLG